MAGEEGVRADGPMETSELRVLSAGAVKSGVARVSAAFERASGTRVAVEFATVPELRRKLAAGAAPDVVVATPAVMEELAARGAILPDSRGFVGRSRMGVVVHRDATVPQLADTEFLVRLLRGASAVVHNRASSGLYAGQLLERLGLARALGSRLVVVESGAAVLETVAARGPGAVGLAQISEILVQLGRGCPVRLAGPLPEEIQNVTSYEAAATSTARAREAACALARALAAPEAKRIFAETGIF